MTVCGLTAECTGQLTGGSLKAKKSGQTRQVVSQGRSQPIKQPVRTASSHQPVDQSSSLSVEPLVISQSTSQEACPHRQ